MLGLPILPGVMMDLSIIITYFVAVSLRISRRSIFESIRWLQTLLEVFGGSSTLLSVKTFLLLMMF
ncbi:hypothetical protein EDD85DRAFT_833833 [Armillaria nabsnona]|nr:hypothetical protein EDD85DRAFT_833833 [Armillaria nabsnona]